MGLLNWTQTKYCVDCNSW